MPTLQTFNDGMNQDISKLKYPNSAYLEALNFRVLTDEGLSSLALENTKGTKNVINVPLTGGVFYLNLANYSADEGTVTYINLYDPNITADVSASIPYASRTDNYVVYQELLDLITSNNLEAYYSVYYNEERVAIYSLTSGITQYSITVTFGSVTNTTVLDFDVDKFIRAAFILGWGILREEIILFTCDATSTSSTIGGSGQIWKFKIDEVTDQVILPDGTLLPFGTALLPQFHLVYMGNLNFTRDHAIHKEVKTRYESSEIGRVVWTDFFNPLRTINVYDPQVGVLSPDSLNYLASHNLTAPVVTNIIEGGQLVAGNYSYFYRLRSLQGAASTISPLSVSVNLTAGAFSNYVGYVGVAPGTNSEKSVEVTISNLDPTYDIIEIGFCIYQTLDVAQYFFFDSQPIPTSGTVTFSHNGTETYEPLDTDTGTAEEQLNNINRPPDVFKTIEVVRNRLFAANAKTNSKVLDLDTRVYRFNASQEAELYQATQVFGDTPKITIDGSVGPYVWSLDGVVQSTPISDIPDNLDLINPYNDENPVNPLNNSSWLTYSQYKYQADGTTLGGSGSIISYSFHLRKQVADISFITILSPLGAPKAQTDDSFDPGTSTVHPIPAKSFDGPINPIQSQLFMGYQRGEVYRWGIVFYDKQGYPFYVNWIGDIRFPDVAEAILCDTTTTPQEVNLYQLGIQFDLNLTAIPKDIRNQISGWEYVRMERTLTDKTKLGIGMLHFVDSTPNGVLDIGDIRNNLIMNSPVDYAYMVDIPNFHFDIDNQFATGDYIRTIASTVGNYNGILSITYDDAYTTKFVGLGWEALSAQERRTITNRWVVNKSTNQNYIPADIPNGLLLDFYNMMDETDTLEWGSSGDKTDLITIGTPFISHPVPAVGPAKYLVSYERYVTDQYRGNRRSSRYNNEYISTGSFTPNTNNLVSVNSTIVFGGDSLAVWYDHMKVEKNWTEATGWSTAGGGERVGMFYAAECSNLNTEYRRGLRWAKRSFEAADNDSRLYNDFIYNKVYTQTMKGKLFVSPDFNQTLIVEEPHTIHVSDPKLDGERTDSWRFIRINNSMTVTGTYGPINKIIQNRDLLFYYQTDAVGQAAVEERVQVPTEAGAPLTLGTGGVLSRYDYISTDTGCLHQWAVEKTGSGIYHYDIRLNKLCKLSQGEGIHSISDVKGLSSFFRYAFSGTIQNTDKLLMPNRVGIHATFNPEYNSVFFTFIDQVDGEEVSYTISYNENLQAFESFHSFWPSMYLNTRRRMHSILFDSAGHNKIYTHWRGVYNYYYNQYAPSYIKLLHNGGNPIDKKWDNVEIRSEVTLNKVNQALETITRARYGNDYQTTGLLSLIPQANIKRMLRTWRMAVPMDQTNPTAIIKPRVFDKHIVAEFWYDNIPAAERRIVLHDVLFETSTRGVITPRS